MTTAGQPWLTGAIWPGCPLPQLSAPASRYVCGPPTASTDFWNAMEAVGGPQTYLLAGAPNCGKGQPGQIAPVSHGCPAVVMRGIRILNTAEEAA